MFENSRATYPYTAAIATNPFSDLAKGHAYVARPVKTVIGAIMVIAPVSGSSHVENIWKKEGTYHIDLTYSLH